MTTWVDPTDQNSPPAPGCETDEPFPDAPTATLTEAQTQMLVLETIQRNAESLLHTARRHSLCADDAQEAYQRAMEIFLRRASTLDPQRAGAWLHTVTKHEAMAVRRQRQQLVGVEDIDFDRHEARHLPSPDEQIVNFDHLTRSAEALQRLKPNELRALWLKASGQSYNAIAEAQGWTYTKVNRLITEGRRAFLERYAEIEAGRECQRWAGVVSALIDGEATAAMLTEARPHLRNCPACRATVRELRRTNASLSIVLPTGATAVLAANHHESASGFAVRIYEALSGGLHERALTSAMKLQAGLEAASAGKIAAVAASAAAVAGGGIAVIRQDATPPATHRAHPARVVHLAAVSHRPRAHPRASAPRVIAAALPAAAAPVVHAHARASAPTSTHHHVHHEFDPPPVHRVAHAPVVTSEFHAPPARAAVAPLAVPVAHSPAHASAVPTSSGIAKGGEFGP
jgi:RNA polymerase sigma factor (sigma-70 family)